MKRARYMDKPLVPSSSEARTSERAREVLLVSYTFAADIAPEFTETYDIAIGGLAMFTNTALPPNLDLIIDLELRDDVQPNLRLNGTVRWSSYDPLLDKYRTGIAFTSRSTDFERELLRYIDTMHRLRDIGAR